MLNVPVSVGELLDKVSILRIKAERITDPDKLAAVACALEHLEQLVPAESELWLHRLEAVNGKLWEIEDQIRVKERDKDFGPEFVSLARSVYFTNDQRAEIKREIDTAHGSEIAEVKSYEDYLAEAV